MATPIPESAVRHWSQLLAKEGFNSEQEARYQVFLICERHDRQTWGTPNGTAKNKEFAEALPVFHDGVKWKIGQPLQEYVSNMTSDFSDGTNGEPSGAPPSGGGAGSQVGIPDYKYLERKKNRHDKLKALMQRRDPDGTSTNPVDQKIRTRLGEDEDEEDDEFDDPKDVQIEPAPNYQEHPEQHFGWFLNLGSEKDIKQRAAAAGIRLTPTKWDAINDAYQKIEFHTLSFLNSLDGVTFRDEGHDDEGLVGSGWIVPSKQPELWRALTSVPERTFVNLIEVGPLFNMSDPYPLMPPIIRKLLIPNLYLFDKQPGDCPRCRSHRVITTGGGGYQCDNCGNVWNP
jgi:hypothetical protein